MTTEEISNKFDTIVQKAVGGFIMDEYKKSLYLSEAQLVFVRATLKAYEYTDELRHLIGPLLVEVSLGSTDFTQTPKYYSTPIDNNVIMEVVFEEINDEVPTIPLDYNDIHYTLQNPFRMPDQNIGYRVTFSEEFRIYTNQTLTKYLYIYCQYPNPIVLEDFSLLGLEISGVSVETTSQLSDDSVDTIINMATTKAVNDIRGILAPPTDNKKD